MLASSPRLYVINGKLLLPDGRMVQKALVLEGNRIHSILDDVPPGLILGSEDFEFIDAQGMIVTPGLIDQHMHGGLGCDFNTASLQQVRELIRALPAFGVTAIVPTIMTASKIDMMSAATVIEELIHLEDTKGTRILGLHLEGPFLNPQFRGAHPASECLMPTLENMEGFHSPNLKILTMAPELDEDLALTRYLSVQGVRVSAGHSAASAEEAINALKAGVSCVTHVFNAMKPFHHRDPGLMAVALSDPDVYVELIGDGHHVHPEALRLAIRSKALDSVILITDCLALAGMPEGSQMIFGQQPVTLKQGQLVNGEGRLAGSSVFLNSCVKNILRWQLADFGTAIRFASQNPANHLGFGDEMGQITPGYLADLVFWDDTSLQVKRTMVGGEVVYQANNDPVMPGRYRQLRLMDK